MSELQIMDVMDLIVSVEEASGAGSKGAALLQHLYDLHKARDRSLHFQVREHFVQAYFARKPEISMAVFDQLEDMQCLNF